jgi:hypothetical protein
LVAGKNVNGTPQKSVPNEKPPVCQMSQTLHNNAETISDGEIVKRDDTYGLSLIKIGDSYRVTGSVGLFPIDYAVPANRNPEEFFEEIRQTMISEK